MAVSAVDVTPAHVATTRIRRRHAGLRPGVLIPGSVLAIVLVAAVVGPWFTQDPLLQDLRIARQKPFSPGHLLGTDAFGRDILARVVHGARASLLVGVCSVALCLLVGGSLGVVAGFRGGKLDTVIMRLMDMVLAFPTIILALAIAAFLGPSLRNVVIAVAFSQLPHYARLARAQTFSVRERDFITGAHLLGASDVQIVVRHVVPNILAVMSTYALLSVGVTILIEASLSFLGMGVRAPDPSWGGMIAEGRNDLKQAPHIALIPGAVLFMTTLSLNLVADTLRSRPTTSGGDS